MENSVHEKHCVMLTQEQAKEVLNRNHCFSGINYKQKAGSKSHKLRIVTNSSSNHKNGSLNSHIPKGVNLFKEHLHEVQTPRMGNYVGFS